MFPLERCYAASTWISFCGEQIGPREQVRDVRGKIVVHSLDDEFADGREELEGVPGIS